MARWTDSKKAGNYQYMMGWADAAYVHYAKKQMKVLMNDNCEL
jgi:hypothetical protein